MKSVYFHPQYSPQSFHNPYCDHFLEGLEKNYNIIRDCGGPLPRGVEFLRGAFLADFYIVNWLESIGFLRLGFIQYLLAYLGLIIISLRKKPLIWIFHNIHPHQGEDFKSRSLQKYLYEHADLIVAHSSFAAEYARGKAKHKVYYMCHPVEPMMMTNEKLEKVYDIFIWGTIMPYKGIAEFVKHPILKSGKYRVLIVGSCKDSNLDKEIAENCPPNVVYENRRASYQEICYYCQSSKIVLFPYIGESVSSSGALIDTVRMGGTPVGPKTGAFKDLGNEGCCLTYDKVDEIFKIIDEGQFISDEVKKGFCEKNSWEQFAQWIGKQIEEKL